MKISLNWIRDFVDVDMPADELVELLSDLGFPEEGHETVGDDTLIDVEITSNRGDCLSHIGIAREIAAATGKSLRLPEIELPESDEQASSLVDVAISEPQLCSRYIARVIRGVKVGPTPDWMKTRLETIGVRSVNNIVDATNYAMMEIGQPCHAFDLAKLSGDKIIVRRAVPGERMVSIDGTKCELNSEMLVIADQQKPVAIAGVMGGLDTEVGDGTIDILLEDAHFAPVSVRSTGRKLTLKSESSFRFERNIDVEMLEWASRRTAQLITMVAGGTVAAGSVDCYPVKAEKPTVTLRLSRLTSLLGYEIPTDKVMFYFNGLGFEPVLDEAAGTITCTCPTWRNDISREVELIEEAARCYGYSNCPSEDRITIRVVPTDKRQKLSDMLTSYLHSSGFFETVNVTFTDDKTSELFCASDESSYLAVKDVTRKSANILRQSLIGSLLGVMQSNHNNGSFNCRFYELADTFIVEGVAPAGRTIERPKLALACDGDLRVIRGTVEGLVALLDKDLPVQLRPVSLPWASTGAEILAGSHVIGTAGVINKKVAKFFGFKNYTPAAAELDFETMGRLLAGPKPIKPLPKYPSIKRDLSIIVDEQVTWEAIEKAVKAASPKVLEEIEFNEIYRGKNIQKGSKSVMFTMVFRDEDGTLTHETVDGFQKVIVDSLASAAGAQLRTV